MSTDRRASAQKIRRDAMKNREKKKREKEQRKERWRFRKVQRLEDVLSALGLLQTFRELPARVRAKLAQLLPA
jgi:hypothetical protein